MTKVRKNCFILNYAPHYRTNIFRNLIRDLNCDIYCGSKLPSNIKKIDFREFDFKIKELQTIWFFGKLAWMKNQIKLLFSCEYHSYILTGQPFFLSDTFFIMLCFFTNKKVYIWNHSPKNQINTVRYFYNKIIFFLVDGFFLYSDLDRDLMINDYKVDKQKLHVIYNSLDYEKQLKLRDDSIDSNYYRENNFFEIPDLPIIIFIGRLEPNKKIEWLIDAVKILKAKNIHLNLMIVGDGVHRKFLENEALGIGGNIFFYGNSYYEQINGKLLANADLCVSPGNIGLTAIHALSYGTPVCTHSNYKKQMPEFEAIVEGETGIFYDIEKFNLPETINNWLLKSHDRDFIRKKCYSVVDDKYNPIRQTLIFKSVLEK